MSLCRPDERRGPGTMKNFFIYILASHKNGTIYIGVTSDLHRRIQQHKSGTADGFTKKYRVDRLVYFETTPDTYVALQREKQLKEWRRKWKLELIEKVNPEWRELAIG